MYQDAQNFHTFLFNFIEDNGSKNDLTETYLSLVYFLIKIDRVKFLLKVKSMSELYQHHRPFSLDKCRRELWYFSNFTQGSGATASDTSPEMK